MNNTHARNHDNDNKQRALDLGAISAHLTALGDMPLCGHCDPAVTAALADAALLLRTVAQLHDELAAVRLQAANLRAAMRAALGAADDGEPDPLTFLRWELPDYDEQGRR